MAATATAEAKGVVTLALRGNLEVEPDSKRGPNVTSEQHHVMHRVAVLEASPPFACLWNNEDKRTDFRYNVTALAAAALEAFIRTSFPNGMLWMVRNGKRPAADAQEICDRMRSVWEGRGLSQPTIQERSKKLIDRYTHQDDRAGTTPGRIGGAVLITSTSIVHSRDPERVRWLLAANPQLPEELKVWNPQVFDQVAARAGSAYSKKGSPLSGKFLAHCAANDFLMILPAYYFRFRSGLTLEPTVVRLLQPIIPAEAIRPPEAGRTAPYTFLGAFYQTPRMEPIRATVGPDRTAISNAFIHLNRTFRSKPFMDVSQTHLRFLELRARGFNHRIDTELRSPFHLNPLLQPEGKRRRLEPTNRETHHYVTPLPTAQPLAGRLEFDAKRPRATVRSLAGRLEFGIGQTNTIGQRLAGRLEVDARPNPATARPPDGKQELGVGPAKAPDRPLAGRLEYDVGLDTTATPEITKHTSPEVAEQLKAREDGTGIDSVEPPTVTPSAEPSTLQQILSASDTEELSDTEDWIVDIDDAAPSSNDGSIGSGKTRPPEDLMTDSVSWRTSGEQGAQHTRQGRARAPSGRACLSWRRPTPPDWRTQAPPPRRAPAPHVQRGHAPLYPQHAVLPPPRRRRPDEQAPDQGLDWYPGSSAPQRKREREWERREQQRSQRSSHHHHQRQWPPAWP